MAGEVNPIEYIDANKVLNKTGLLELSGQIKGYINTNMPQSYTLPTATTSTLGGVKVDGETITINDGVISATSSGSGSSYTFTNGLTESNGTVSWDLNDRIRPGSSGINSVSLNGPVSGNMIPQALANYSVAEGYGSKVKAQAEAGHAEGYRTTVEGSFQGAHAEGYQTNASGQSAHAEGYYTNAHGQSAHAEGYATYAYAYQHTEGKYNIYDVGGQFSHIIGNGSSAQTRSNAMAIGWSGNEYLAGNLYINCIDFTTNENGFNSINCGGSKVATESYVDTAIANAGGGGSTTYTAGTGISIVNGVISLDLATAEEGEF